MRSKTKHIAIIPARKNSRGLRFKNRLLFNYTKNFLQKIRWFDEIILASDDNFFKHKCIDSNFTFYNRDKKNATDNASIKSLMQEIIKNFFFDKEVVIWLFYLTIPERNKSDFKKLKTIAEKKNFLSSISFIPVKTHPYDCWIINKNIKKFIKNDVFRRQDKIKLFEHHHYLCAFKVKELNKLNSELINSKTTPIILKKNIIEVDSKKDFSQFVAKKGD